MGCPAGRVDGVQGHFCKGVGVFVVVIGEHLLGPGHLAVVIKDVARDVGGEVEGVVPGNVHHAAADAQARMLQPVPGGGVGVVELLGKGAAAHAVVSADVNNRGISVRNDQDVVGLAANGDDVLHVGRNPLAG